MACRQSGISCYSLRRSSLLAPHYTDPWMNGPVNGRCECRAPALPRGAVRGCSYMKLRVEGRFILSPGWSPTPPNSMLNRLSSSRGSPWCFSFFERIRFQDFFYFFVEKTLLLTKNQHFIIIITFHQITHQLVLSIFTWDFIFSSKFSL